MSKVMRIPEEMAEQARAFAAVEGISLGEVLTKAWDAYVLDHADEMAAHGERMAELLRAGDLVGLAEEAREYQGYFEPAVE